MDLASADVTRTRRGFWGAMWAGARATIGGLMGLAPHVMHHIGFLAGAAILTGFLGNAVLYGLGMLLSIPLLGRLRRRFGTWKAPMLGVAVFSGFFAISAFVIGPLFNPAASDEPTVPAPTADASATSPEEHAGHHE